MSIAGQSLSASSLDPLNLSDDPVVAAFAAQEGVSEALALDLGLDQAAADEAARAPLVGAAVLAAPAPSVADDGPDFSAPSAPEGAATHGDDALVFDAPAHGMDEPQENGSGTGTVAVAATGNQAIDGLLSGVRWNATFITYSDPDSVADYQAGHPEAFSNFQQINADQLRTAHAALNSAIYTQPFGGIGNSVEGFTNLTIDYAGAGSGAGTIRMANTSNPGTAYAYYPSSGVWGGDAFFGNSGRTPVTGNYHYHTVIHELGHALGLKHGQETGGVAGPLPSDWDSMEFSVMTYKSFIGDNNSGYNNEQFGYAQTWMMLDIAALQQMYGADFTTNSSNTSYTWDPNNGSAYVNGVLSLAPGANRIFSTIWDGGGVDTYDLSNYGTNLSIDLAPGGYSTFSSAQRAYLGGGPNGGFARGNVFNALQYNGDSRSLIENATGGSGHDTIYGNNADNVLIGNAGNDYLWGGSSGNDTLIGGDGNDVLNGGGGSDASYGGNGDDYIYAVLGTPETIDGGAGVDTLNTTLFAFDYVVNLETGLTDWAGESFINMENLISGIGSDTLTGTNGANSIWGGAGNDVIAARGGNDIVYGEDGNDNLGGGTGVDQLYGGAGNDVLGGGDGADILDGGTGADDMRGGAGADTYYVDNVGDAVTEGAVGPNDRVFASVSFALGTNIENLTLTGTAANGTGNTLNNVILGNGVANTLSGGQGNDLLRGLGANDILIGGVGADDLRGGTGADTFRFTQTADSSWALFDTITAEGATPAMQGVGAAGGDVIDLSFIDANENVAGNQAFSWNSTGVGGLSIINDGDVTRVRGNTNGASGFEFRLEIHDGTIVAGNYQPGDFIL